VRFEKFKSSRLTVLSPVDVQQNKRVYKFRTRRTYHFSVFLPSIFDEFSGLDLLIAVVNSPSQTKQIRQVVSSYGLSFQPEQLITSGSISGSTSNKTIAPSNLLYDFALFFLKEIVQTAFDSQSAANPLTQTQETWQGMSPFSLTNTQFQEIQNSTLLSPHHPHHNRFISSLLIQNEP
jgi:hypothetical protein